jgi:hypothetical protein
MIEIEATGGLGDIFRVLHETTAYEDIERLGPGETARVVLISHNPFCDEIFRWHPKHSQIEVISSRYFFHEYKDAARRRDAGVPERAPEPRPRRERAPIRFYPSSEDMKAIEARLPNIDFLAVAPTASGMEIENRSIPQGILERIASIAKIRGVPVVFLGRTYPGPHAPKVDPQRPVNWTTVDLTDRLSVPGTAEVLKRARATVCAHSALLLLSWYERKPNFVTYPPKYKTHDFDNDISPFGFGKNYPETVRMLFSEFTPSRFDDFLTKNFPRSI